MAGKKALPAALKANQKTPAQMRQMGKGKRSAKGKTSK